MSDLTTSHLDKYKIYITYCDGIGCNASTKGALKLSWSTRKFQFLYDKINKFRETLAKVAVVIALFSLSPRRGDDF